MFVSWWPKLLLVLWVVPEGGEQVLRLEFTNADAVNCREQGEVPLQALLQWF